MIMKGMTREAGKEIVVTLLLGLMEATRISCQLNTNGSSMTTSQCSILNKQLIYNFIHNKTRLDSPGGLTSGVCSVSSSMMAARTPVGMMRQQTDM
jgi:hypothetical protein